MWLQLIFFGDISVPDRRYFLLFAQYFYSTYNVSVKLTAQLKYEADSSVDKCV